MLFSGLGDVEKAQETLSVGVGALAGSTIMLLTVPWGLCVLKGGVNFTEPGMLPDYKRPSKFSLDAATLSTTGVALSPAINHGAKMMMLTTLPYFIIQIPAFFLTGTREAVSNGEHNWAAGGFIVCVTFFVGYLYSQVKESNDTAHKLRRMTVIKESLKKGAMSLKGALGEEVYGLIKKENSERSVAGEATPLCSVEHPPSHRRRRSLDGDSIDDPPPDVVELLKGILGDTFHFYDQDGNGNLSKREFSQFLKDFHETVSTETLDETFSLLDKDSNNTLCYDEFIIACYLIITTNDSVRSARPNRTSIIEVSAAFNSRIINDENEDNDDDDEEEEQVPEDFTSLSPEEQQFAIKKRAFTMLFIGTTLVLVFSDPMVEVLSEVAVRLDIPAFYVSFILAPLASNASEVIASQYYAAKKTRKTITVALTALEGAASMNNTFCLSIFMALIYFRGLAWQYSAETISIILVQFLIGHLALRGKMTTFTGLIVLALFPLSVVFVAVLEFLGMD
jgi:Ca2+/Na+ antiporter